MGVSGAADGAVVTSQESVDQRKRELRAYFRALRRELGEGARREADKWIAVRIAALPAFVEAEVVLTYLDVGPEVRTREVIEQAWATGKVVALPRCVPGTREMRWYRVSTLDGLVRSPFGVWEPVGDEQELLEPDVEMRAVALVPGLTFDTQGYRLGYGGGFYDRFLAGFGGVSVGLCREAQMSDDLCAAGVVDTYDLPVRMVATEARVISF